MEQRAEELSAYLRGWSGYFSFCQTPSVLERLDQWLRRRLRSAIWKRWSEGASGLRSSSNGVWVARRSRRPRKRRAALMVLGGGSPTAPLSALPCAMLTSTRSGFLV
jgi:hypothetical protein